MDLWSAIKSVFKSEDNNTSQDVEEKKKAPYPTVDEYFEVIIAYTEKDASLTNEQKAGVKYLVKNLQDSADTLADDFKSLGVNEKFNLKAEHVQNWSEDKKGLLYKSAVNNLLGKSSGEVVINELTVIAAVSITPYIQEKYDAIPDKVLEQVYEASRGKTTTKSFEDFKADGSLSHQVTVLQYVEKSKELGAIKTAEVDKVEELKSSKTTELFIHKLNESIAYHSPEGNAEDRNKVYGNDPRPKTPAELIDKFTDKHPELAKSGYAADAIGDYRKSMQQVSGNVDFPTSTPLLQGGASNDTIPGPQVPDGASR